MEVGDGTTPTAKGSESPAMTPLLPGDKARSFSPIGGDGVPETPGGQGGMAVRGSVPSRNQSTVSWLVGAMLRQKPLWFAQQDDSGASGKHLKRALGVFDLLAYGVGCTVGAGVYSLLSPGFAAAGPALVISFMVGALSCVFTGLGYAEFAARVPIAGSAYTYCYVSFNEITAWFIGWTLTLEYAISAAAIARSWGQYVGEVVNLCGGSLPDWVTGASEDGETVAVSVLAALAVLLFTLVMVFGISKSSQFNMVVTAANVAVLLFVTFAGATKAKASNWTVVDGSFAPYGGRGIVAGAAKVFFSYIGFDATSSLAAEVKNPQRDLPIGILGSLVASSLIYVAVTLVVSAMVPFTELVGSDAPLSVAFDLLGMNWAAWIVTAGALFGTSAACFTTLLAQPRIFFGMAVDGLLWPMFSKMSSLSVPLAGTVVTGLLTALIAAFMSLEALADAISVGTLMAFAVVNAGVVLLRYSGVQQKGPFNTSWASPATLLAAFSLASFLAAINAQSGGPLALSIVLGLVAAAVLVALHFAAQGPAPKTFACPLVPLFPCLGIAVNCVMLAGLDKWAWLRVLAWTAIGMVIYFTYGIYHAGKWLRVPRDALDRVKQQVERENSGSSVGSGAGAAVAGYGTA